jgi:hypothetical protein
MDVSRDRGINAEEATMADNLPKGLQETVDDFLKTIKKAKKAEEMKIDYEMKDRLQQDYKDNEDIWQKVGNTVLGFVRMGARLAVEFARDNETVTWENARLALKAVQEECKVIFEREPDRRLGRHCRSADFNRP